MIFNLFKDKHLKKTYSSSVFKELWSSNAISFNDVHFLNVQLIIYFIEEGIAITFNDEHYQKKKTL